MISHPERPIRENRPTTSPNESQFKPWKDEPLLSRREAIRDTLAIFGVVGGFLAGEQVRQTQSQDLTQTLKPLVDRVRSLETQMTGTQALVVSFTDGKATVQRLSDYMNQIAALEVADAKRIKDLITWANHQSQPVLFLGDQK